MSPIFVTYHQLVWSMTFCTIEVPFKDLTMKEPSTTSTKPPCLSLRQKKTRHISELRSKKSNLCRACEVFLVMASVFNISTGLLRNVPSGWLGPDSYDVYWKGNNVQ